MICLCTWRKKTVTHGGYSRGEFFSSNWNRKSRDNLSLLLLFVTTYYAEKSSLEKIALLLMLFIKSSFNVVLFRCFLWNLPQKVYIRCRWLGLNVNPLNTKIFTHQKRISEHLVMNSKYCLFWIDLASIWKYMPCFFVNTDFVHKKQICTIIFLQTLF